MDGIILFADDAVFQDSFEKKLFENLIQNSKYPVLPINNLSDFENSAKSISTFRAILLDWEFIERLEGIDQRKNPLSILLTNNFYSLIFIYSYTDLGEETKETLKKKYGSKIDFLPKIRDDKQIDSESKKIFAAIENFQKENLHLTVPFIWSQAINKSIQSIFKELETADKFWVKDLYYSSFLFDEKGNPKGNPPVDPNIQVINLFQYLLAEQLIQDTHLQQSIESYSKDNLKNKSIDKALQDLYKRLYYTHTLSSDTVMTGDVFEISPNNFGIVVSPECDVNTLIKKDKEVELLCFHKDDFKNNIRQILQIGYEVEKIARTYNQENPRIHLLPAFDTSNETVTGLIDFRFCLQHIKGSFLEENKKLRRFKINSPYIQQLRQRYLAYIGRVGVPSIPNSLRFTP